MHKLAIRVITLLIAKRSKPSLQIYTTPNAAVIDTSASKDCQHCQKQQAKHSIPSF